jgi:PAS domain S-box-containing protein
MQEIQQVVREIAAQDQGEDADLVKFVLKSIPFATLIIYLPHRIIGWCNNAAKEVLGYEKSEIIGNSTRMLHIDDREFHALAEKYLPVVSDNGVFRGRHWMKHAEGFHLPVEFVITPIRKIGDQLLVVGFIQTLFRSSDLQLREGLTRLTQREREVFDLTCQGLSAKGVARHLEISQRTAEVHRSAILDKLGYRTTTELLATLLAAKRAIET